MITIRLSYYPDITQYQSAQTIFEAIRLFSARLQEEYSKRINTPVTIEVMDVMSVRAQTQIMQSGECGIGLMKPVSYVLAQQHNKNVVPAAVAWRVIGQQESDTYFAQLYTHKDSGIYTLGDIGRRHRIAFGDSFSTSNFLIPAVDLLRNGIHPFTSVRMVKYFGGHDGASKAVYFNDADVGAGHDGVISLLAQEKGFEDAQTRLVQLSRVDIYSDPVVARADLVPDVSKLTESLVAISELSEVKKALQDFWGNVSRLGPADPTRYDTISEALTLLNLSADTIL